MSDDKSKVSSNDRQRVALDQPYEVEDFHQKHPHLSHQQAVDIIRSTRGDRKRADEIAQQRR
jgi:hypothetical protein